MKIGQHAFLAGPLVIRDIVVGTGGVAVSALAFLAGCAFASTGNLVWFAFLGALGVLSLRTAVPAVVTAHRLAQSLAEPGQADEPLRIAA
jgi:hypothetical protein